MACLPILEYPDPRLRIRATPVAAVDDDIRALVADMRETRDVSPGIGLAAGLTTPTDGLGAVGGYASLPSSTALGGSLTVWSLP